MLILLSYLLNWRLSWILRQLTFAFVLIFAPIFVSLFDQEAPLQIELHLFASYWIISQRDSRFLITRIHSSDLTRYLSSYRPTRRRWNRLRCGCMNAWKLFYLLQKRASFLKWMVAAFFSSIQLSSDHHAWLQSLVCDCITSELISRAKFSRAAECFFVIKHLDLLQSFWSLRLTSVMSC